MNFLKNDPTAFPLNTESVLRMSEKARLFLEQLYAEWNRPAAGVERWKEVYRQIADTGSWEPTLEELTHGARMAWRNSNRCIGRLSWKSLRVIDARHLDSPREAAEALQHHLVSAFNDGQLLPTLTVFRAKRPNEAHGPRILNQQLLHYAGFTSETGQVRGEPAELEFTKFCQDLGWRPERDSYEFLPWVIAWPQHELTWFPVPTPDRWRVPLQHPEWSWFQELGWEWYAIPVISDMLLEIGGLEFTAAPFNGWYMGTEIGSRNLGDRQRWNLIPTICERLGWARHPHHQLAVDRALVELNRAVLFSFEKAGVRLVDHHTAAEQFLTFADREQSCGREVQADWAWITPPLGGNATPVFHQEFSNQVLSPNFFYQATWVGPPRVAAKPGCPFHAPSTWEANSRPSIGCPVRSNPASSAES